MRSDHHSVSASRSVPQRTHLPRLILLCALPAMLWSSSAAEAGDREKAAAELVRWATGATEMLIEGDLSGAVQALGRARQAAARPELDAFVGLVGLVGTHRQEALTQLTAAIDHGSTEPMVFYWTARAAWSLGRGALARRRMHQAATLSPKNPTIAMGQTLMLITAGQRVPAARALVIAAALEPNLLDPILYPSPVEGAIGLLGTIVDHPARLQVLRTQGYFYWRAQRVTAALRSFSVIVRQRPKDGDALQMIARCQMALGQETLALETARRAVLASPDHPHTYATRGEILLDLGQAELAIGDLQRAADLLPRDGRLLTRLADACAEAEKPDCARRYYAYAAERDKQNPAAHFGLALAYQQQRKYKLSTEALRQAIHLDPGQARFYQAAAHLARLQGKSREANKYQAQARELAAQERRHKRIMQRISGRIQRQVDALTSLAAHPRCAPPCARTLQALWGPARTYLKIHLAERGKQSARALQLALTLLQQLNPRRLLNSDPTELKFKVKSINGKPFTLRKAFPFALPSRFR